MFITLNNAGVAVFWPGIILLGLFIGFLSGSMGVGGGFLLTPFLHYVFHVPFETAIGSGLSVIVITSLSGAFVHYRKGNVSLKLAALLICGSVPGVKCGVSLLGFLKKVSLQNGSIVTPHVFDNLLGAAFLLLLLMSMLLMVKDIIRLSIKMKTDRAAQTDLKTYRLKFFIGDVKIYKNLPDNSGKSLNIILIVLFGFFVGILSGLLGVGGGIIITPVFITVIGLPSLLVIGTSIMQLTITGFTGAVLHALSGHADLILIVLIASASVIGSVFGSRFISKMRGMGVRILYAVFLFLSSLFILGEMIFMR